MDAEDTGNSSVSLTPEQAQALFGGPCEEGQEYTVKLVAGPPSEEDGGQMFSVVHEDVADETPAEDAAEPADTEGTAADKPVDQEGPPSLGYDRSKLMQKRQKKSAPPMGAASLL